jgi:hypothetical protein
MLLQAFYAVSVVLCIVDKDWKHAVYWILAAAININVAFFLK